MDMGEKKIIEVELYEAEKEYLEEYFRLMDRGGISEVAKACEERRFAMMPFDNIIKRLVKNWAKD